MKKYGDLRRLSIEVPSLGSRSHFSDPEWSAAALHLRHVIVPGGHTSLSPTYDLLQSVGAPRLVHYVQMPCVDTRGKDLFSRPNK